VDIDLVEDLVQEDVDQVVDLVQVDIDLEDLDLVVVVLVVDLQI
jgi:hypothetical protein